MEAEMSEVENLRNRVRRLERQSEPQDEVQPMKSIKGQMASGMAMRRTARGAMEDEIQNLRRRAEQMETLLGSLPAVLSPEADEALWSLVNASRRPY